MHRRHVFIILATIMSANFCATAIAGSAVKMRAGKVNQMSIDGAVDDWKGIPVAYYESGPRLTAIAHDDQFVYIHFRFSDPALMHRVLQFGATLWLNCSNAHKMSFGLRYRGNRAIEKVLATQAVPTATPTSDAPSGDQRRDDSKSKDKKPERAPIGALEILQHGRVEEVVEIGKKPDGVAAASGMTDGAFSFEFRVPIVDLCPDEQPQAGKLPTKIAIGFQIGGVTIAELSGVIGRVRDDPSNRNYRSLDRYGGSTPYDRRRSSFDNSRGVAPTGDDRSRDSEEPPQIVEVFWVEVELVDTLLPTPAVK